MPYHTKSAELLKVFKDFNKNWNGFSRSCNVYAHGDIITPWHALRRAYTMKLFEIFQEAKCVS